MDHFGFTAHHININCTFINAHRISLKLIIRAVLTNVMFLPRCKAFPTSQCVAPVFSVSLCSSAYNKRITPGPDFPHMTELMAVLLFQLLACTLPHPHPHPIC